MIDTTGEPPEFGGERAERITEASRYLSFLIVGFLSGLLWTTGEVGISAIGRRILDLIALTPGEAGVLVLAVGAVAALLSVVYLPLSP